MNIKPVFELQVDKLGSCLTALSTAQNTRKPFGGRGSAIDPAEGTYSAPANPLVGGEGLAVPSRRISYPTLGPSGLASSTPIPKLVLTPMFVRMPFLSPPMTHVGTQAQWMWTTLSAKSTCSYWGEKLQVFVWMNCNVKKAPLQSLKSWPHTQNLNPKSLTDARL